MHPSTEMFDQIEALWTDRSLSVAPAFFCRAGDAWERVAADDLETFYGYVHAGNFQATVIVTPYSVGERSLIVAHYESSNEASHRIWSLGGGQTLSRMYESPVQMRRSFAPRSRAA